MPRPDTSFAKHFVGRRTVLFGECDPAGVMYTPRIFECIIETALKFISNSLGEPFERYVFAQNRTLPARNVTVDFLRPVTWDDQIKLHAGIVNISEHAYTVQVCALDKSDAVAFTGNVTQVCVDKGSRNIAPLPEQFRAALERHQ